MSNESEQLMAEALRHARPAENQINTLEQGDRAVVRAVLAVFGAIRADSQLAREIVAADPAPPDVRPCASCSCCVGTYDNYQGGWLCAECSNGDPCPRQRARSAKAAREQRRVRLEADDAVAQSNTVLANRAVADQTDPEAGLDRLRRVAGHRSVNLVVDDQTLDSFDQKAASADEACEQLLSVAPGTVSQLAVHVSYLTAAVRQIKSQLNAVVWPDPDRDAEDKADAAAIDQALADREADEQPVAFEDLAAELGLSGREQRSVNFALTAGLGRQATQDDLVSGFHTNPEPQGGGASVTDAVLDLLRTRRAHGTAKYGTQLTAHNGRNALKDLQEELADALCYVTQALMEQDAVSKFGPTVRKVDHDVTVEILRQLADAVEVGGTYVGQGVRDAARNARSWLNGDTVMISRTTDTEEKTDAV